MRRATYQVRYSPSGRPLTPQRVRVTLAGSENWTISCSNFNVGPLCPHTQNSSQESTQSLLRYIVVGPTTGIAYGTWGPSTSATMWSCEQHLVGLVSGTWSRLCAVIISSGRRQHMMTAKVLYAQFDVYSLKAWQQLH